MNEIIYDCRWSDEVDDKFISDFIKTQNTVFGGNYTKELFNKKYIKNLYGKSVVEVVYLDGEPVAARGLWRNDILNKPSYQPGDTCVTEVCRGKGIFTEMTKKSLELLSAEDVIYNFPNQNSYPGYIKMGWNLIKEYGLMPFMGAKGYLKEHPVKMDKEYADWWLKDNNGFSYFKSGNEYFLVRPLRKFCYKICACVPKEVALKFNKKAIGICFYRSEKKTFYNKKIGFPIRVVSKQNIDYIPLWKMDVI